MARFLYSWLFYLVTPLVWLRLLWRARRQPEYLQHLAERFARYPTRPTPPTLPTRPVLWLHAVSVGETRAIAPLVKALLARHADHQLLITCMTPTGRATALALYGGLATVTYLPYDFAFAQRRFLLHWRPVLGVLMETELWPNLLFEAKAAGVPMALINARLSERSARGYARFSGLARPALNSLSAVGAQTAADAARLRAVGAPSAVVCGNLKFEVQPSEQGLAVGHGWRAALHADKPSQPRFIWLAASTRDGEEKIILDALKILGASAASDDASGQAPLLVLVPRHPQRFDEVAALLAAQGFRLQRRSNGTPTPATQVWLGDSMGEMAAYYAMADLCVIGGSLLPFGSQNLIEACACACPVLAGPSDFNFRQATGDAIAHGAACRVEANAEGLAQAIDRLMTDAAALQTMRQAAQEFALAHRGATEKTQAVLDGLLNKTKD